MSDARRVVLVKPGDVLLIGNLEQIDEASLDGLSDSLVQLRDALGLSQVLLFASDIDLAVTTASTTEADA